MRSKTWFDLMRKVFHFLSQSLPPPLKVSAAASQWVVSSLHFSKSQLFVQASTNPKSSPKSNIKMTISSDIGSVLHQPCAVPGLLQSRFALLRSLDLEFFRYYRAVFYFHNITLMSLYRAHPTP